MNKHLLFKSSLLEYLNNKYFDYALLCNGPWGIGKSYFFENEFPHLLKNNTNCEYTPILVSVSGCTSPIEVKRRIYFEILCNLTTNKTRGKISLEMQQYCISLMPQELLTQEKLKPIVDTFEQIAQKMTEINKVCENSIILIDDLERYGNIESIEDLLAELHVSYVENGAHLIYIADESKILNDKYKERKEKYIRNTVSMYLDLDHSIKSIISKREKQAKTKFKILYESNYHDEILKSISACNIENLRFLIQAIDTFEFFIKSQAIDMLQQEHLFLTILMHVNYKAQDLKCTFNEYLESKHISTDPWGFYLNENYKNLRYTVYRECDEINNYLESGYIDTKEHQEFINKYYPTSNTYVESYYMLIHDYESHDENTLKELVTNLITGVTNKKIPYTMLFALGNTISIIENDLPDLAQLLRDGIQKAIDDRKYPGRSNYLESFTMQDYPFTYSEFGTNILNHFTTVSKIVQTKAHKNKFMTFFKTLNEDKCNVSDTGFPDDFFKLLKDSNMFIDVFNLSNKGLFHMRQIIEYTAEYYLNEQSTELSALADYIATETKANKNISTIRKNRLKSLCNCIYEKISRNKT